LGAYENQVLVVNFWATWCAPCREEMPAFSRLNDRWASKGVRFVGLSDEEPAQVAAFARERPVSYPLWTGGDAVGELARRLGNRLGVLPFTVVLERGGRVLESRVGPYTEQELESRLAAIATNSVKR
jgi:thiol-disulfide isomerase/thioredoxin